MDHDQTKKIANDFKAYFEAVNQARRTKDPIDMKRAERAGQTVAEQLEHVKRGHMRVRDQAFPLLLAADAYFGISAYVPPLWQASRPLTHDLVRLVRTFEDRLRLMLATLTGDDVPPRDTSHDATEDLALSAPDGTDPNANMKPKSKLILS